MSEYIKLYTKTQLSETEQDVWYGLVRKSLSPEMAFNRADTQYRELDHDDYKHSYTIWLADRPDNELVEEIVFTWQDRYDGDFEIETSTELMIDDDTDDNDIELQEEVYKLIQKRAAQYFHNKWVEESLDSGWRYGMKLDKKDKTHPALREWSSLHPEYQRMPAMTPKQALAFFIKNKHLF